MVAHRVSTVRDADEIVAMEAGAIVERGRHDVLVKQSGLYSRLVGDA
jgi:ATP-binding cassette subfamily B protein